MLLAAWAENNRIRHTTFEECEILGPALVYSIGPTYNVHSSIQVEVSVEAISFDIQEGRHVIGLVGLDGVTFSRCSFRGIGFAGMQADFANFRQAMLPGKRPRP